MTIRISYLVQIVAVFSLFGSIWVAGLRDWDLNLIVIILITIVLFIASAVWHKNVE